MKKSIEIILTLSVSTRIGHTYFNGPSKLSYTDAAAYCHSQNTTLASIPWVKDWNDAISVCRADHCWIGLRYDLSGDDDFTWSWEDGIDIAKSFGFNSNRTATTGQGPWNTDEPKEWEGYDEHCVSIDAITGKYNDTKCDESWKCYPLCNTGRYLQYFFIVQNG